jgi:hypothetical protein
MSRMGFLVKGLMLSLRSILRAEDMYMGQRWRRKM